MTNNNSIVPPTKAEADEPESAQPLETEAEQARRGESISISSMGWAVTLSSQTLTIPQLLDLAVQVRDKFFNAKKKTKLKSYCD